jgi:hypothetical protein
MEGFPRVLFVVSPRRVPVHVGGHDPVVSVMGRAAIGSPRGYRVRRLQVLGGTLPPSATVCVL